MSKGGGGAQTTSTSQTSEPWGPAQPLLKGALSDAGKWYSSPYGTNPYPNSTVVPFSPYTEQALGMTANRAVNGSPVMNQANQTLQGTLRGDYLSPGSNPWLSSTFDAAAGKVRSGLDSQFNKSGNYAGSLHQGAMAQNYNDLANSIYGGNYENERQRQMQGMLFAPQAAASDYTDASNLGAVGAAYEGQAGKNLTDSVNRYDFYQQQPYNRLQQLVNLAQPVGASGGLQSGTQSTPTQSNGISNVLGSLASIAGIAGAFSAREAKTEIQPMSAEDILKGICKVPISHYRYKEEVVEQLGNSFAGEKVGPMADDFAQAFGGSAQVIPMDKMLGLLWGAVKLLIEKVALLEERAAK